MTTCPKCGYERKPTDTAPDWQCPRCEIAYAKYQPPSSEGTPISAKSDVASAFANELDNIKEFQRRMREFLPRFQLTLLLGGPPAVGLISISEKFPRFPLAIIGVVVALVTAARAIYLWHRYLRCPSCDTLLSRIPGLQFPHLKCPECEARLSRGPLLTLKD